MHLRSCLVWVALAAACGGGQAAGPDAGECPDEVDDPGRALAIEPAEGTVHIADGDSVQLTALSQGDDVTGGGEIDGCPAPTSWTSSDPDIATVEAGLVRAGTRTGTAEITARFAGATANPAVITVLGSAVVVDLTVAPGSVSLPAGLPQQFTAEARYRDDRVTDVTALAEWSSSDPQVVGSGGAGLFTGLAEGSAEVTASLGGQSHDADFNVLPPVAVGLAVEPEESTLCLGGRRPLTARARLSDGTVGALPDGTVTWYTAAPGFRVGDTSGVVLADGLGSGTVTATLGTPSGVLTGDATVTSMACERWLLLEPPELTAAVGQTARFTAILSDPWGTRADVTADLEWTSTLAPVAAVVAPGEVSAAAPGLTEVMAWDPVTGLFVTGDLEVVPAPTPPACAGEDVIWTGDHHVFGAADVAAIAGCTTLTGTLFIEGTDLTEIDGLASLTSIDRLVVTYNAALVDLGGLQNVAGELDGLAVHDNDALIDLTGLDGVTFIDGTVNVERNRALRNLKGLEGLREIDGSLLVSENRALTSVSGLDALELVGDYFYLTGSPELDSLAALGALRELGGGLTIEASPALVSLQGLEGLIAIGRLAITGPSITSLVPLEQLIVVRSLNLRSTSVSELDAFASITELPDGLALAGNPNLLNVDGLAQVSRVGGYLVIEDNDNLAHLDSLSRVGRVNGALRIQGNQVLSSVAGLRSVGAATGGPFEITDNPILPTCAAEALHVVWVAVGYIGAVVIAGNDDSGVCM